MCGDSGVFERLMAESLEHVGEMPHKEASAKATKKKKALKSPKKIMK